MVYLVGAGPGDPELITVRGLNCIRQADVLVYDRLVATALVEQARPGTLLIYAGKAPGRHEMTQAEIDDLLVALGRQGKVVCRLKGGDPFVFGRGGEEAEALVAAGIPFAVVPGVTSAIAVPAAAGIPVTHRGTARAFTVITGHEKADDDGAGVNWEAAAQLGGTLVLLMAVANLAAIAERLAAGGLAPETPVAIVERGTCPDQRVVTATLSTVAAAVAAAGVRSPAVVVVGAVVRQGEVLRQYLREVGPPAGSSHGSAAHGPVAAAPRAASR
jgi:uroporphyrin-III C-methyltransferase